MSEWKESDIGRIPNSWNIGTLEDICQLITDGAHLSPKLVKSDYYMASVKDMRYNYFDFTDCKTISKEDFEALEKGKCSPEYGDILLSKDGANCLDLIFVYKQNERIVLLSSIAIARLKKENNPDFYRYYLLSPNIQDIMRNNYVSGSAIPRVILKDFKNVPVPILPETEQTAIASILSSLDDKIDLLHRQNATLEKMAETLFRQWFVEEAKEDWEVGTLDDILSVKGGTTPSTSEPKYWNGSIYWTSPKDITNLNGIYLFDTERKITELGLSKISSGVLPKGTLLMSSRAPVGVLAFSEVPVAINQGYIAILDNKGYSKEFIYLWLKINIDVVHSFSNGSTFMEISKSAFKSLQLQIPPKPILNKFQQLVKSLFDKIKSNTTQIHTLTALRDTLLPKLMSGEVKVEY